jgi:hypothetical protein
MDTNVSQPVLGMSGERLPVKKGFFREVFGQFLTAMFWRELAKTIIHEMVTAFFMALGGSLLWYGKKKSNPETKDIRESGGINTARPVSPASSAFSQSFSPTPDFSRPTYPTPMSHDNAVFPGFGGR